MLRTSITRHLEGFEALTRAEVVLHDGGDVESVCKVHLLNSSRRRQATEKTRKSNSMAIR